MFEEIAVWERRTPDLAIRYVGFRSLETGHVWIALANYLSTADEDLPSGALFGDAGVLESFLQDLPSSGDSWKPTILEAIAHFIESNPDD